MNASGVLRTAAVLLVLALGAVTVTADIPQSERDALIALYNSTNGQNWNNRTNWRNASDTDFNAPGTEGTWAGVACNADQTHVVRVDIYCNNMNGYMPPEIGDLPELQYLRLVEGPGKLPAPLPLEIGNLGSLRELQLAGLSATGGIPPSFGNLTNLESLSLQANQLTGPIPVELGQLSNLRYLDINSNQLTGDLYQGLPTSWVAGLQNLKLFWVQQNSLSGPLPAEFGSLPALEVLGIDFNQFSGLVPIELGNLPNIKKLYLGFNHLEGPIPPSLGSLSHLADLELFSNRITGTLPPELGQMTELQFLSLGANPLMDPEPVPTWLYGLTHLTYLDLRNMNLTGGLSPAIGNLQQLQTLYLGSNQLTGAIPPEIGSLANLQWIAAGLNQLSGSIPGEIGQLAQLQVLDLNNNQLTGPIPATIGNLHNVWALGLPGNHFSGSLPTSIGGMTSLQDLALYSNDLEGPIPHEIGLLSSLRSLNLLDNRLSGPLPDELGNLTNLIAINIGHNGFTGPIPASLYNLTGLFDGWSRISWNGLYTNDAGLAALLQKAECCGFNWQASQTIAPAGIAVDAVTPESVQLSWTPILYTGDSGAYRVLYSTISHGPYTVFGTTADKTVSSMTVTGLTDGVTYYFAVQAITYPHMFNRNTLESELSAEVSATTVPLNRPPLLEAGPDQSSIEGQSASLAPATFSDPDAGDTHSGTVDWGDGTVAAGVISESGGSGTVSGTHTYTNEGSHLVRVTVVDSYGATAWDSFTVTVGNAPPLVGAIAAPLDPTCVGTGISASGSFTDAGIFDTHTASWEWGDGTNSPGLVNESGGSGVVTGTHVYPAAGIYTLALTVTDDGGAAAANHFEFVVVYDPEGGFVTGGGWITSPPGAYAPAPTLTGRASFGFVSRYHKGAAVPTGTTEFQFRAAGLNFHSDRYQWLVVAGCKAQYKGDGTINGGGDLGFMLSATDGQLPGGGGADKFRIRIWDKVTGLTIYDNQMEAPDDQDPTTTLGGGSIVIHKG